MQENNQIYVCGQARTHCVKDSIMDLLKNCGEEREKDIFLINDCTSPILNPPDTPNEGKAIDVAYPLEKEVSDNLGEVTTSTELLSMNSTPSAATTPSLSRDVAMANPSMFTSADKVEAGLSGGKKTRKRKSRKSKKSRKLKKVRKSKKERRHTKKRRAGKSSHTR